MKRQADEAIANLSCQNTKLPSQHLGRPYFGRAAEGYHGVLWQSEQLTFEKVELALPGPEFLAGTAHAFGKAKSAARAVSPGSHS
jgi:hypothetical protein